MPFFYYFSNFCQRVAWILSYSIRYGPNYVCNNSNTDILNPLLCIFQLQPFDTYITHHFKHKQRMPFTNAFCWNQCTGIVTHVSTNTFNLFAATADCRIICRLQSPEHKCERLHALIRIRTEKVGQVQIFRYLIAPHLYLYMLCVLDTSL